MERSHRDKTGMDKQKLSRVDLLIYVTSHAYFAKKIHIVYIQCYGKGPEMVNIVNNKQLSLFLVLDPYNFIALDSELILISISTVFLHVLYI